MAKLASCCLRSRISAWSAWVSELKTGPATPLSKAKVAEAGGAAIAGALAVGEVANPGAASSTAAPAAAAASDSRWHLRSQRKTSMATVREPSLSLVLSALLS